MTPPPRPEGDGERKRRGEREKGRQSGKVRGRDCGLEMASAGGRLFAMFANFTIVGKVLGHLNLKIA